MILGLLLVAAGLLWGEGFALFVSHELNANLVTIWRGLLPKVSGMTPAAVESTFAQLAAIAARRAHAMSLHSHLVAFGLLTALLAIVDRELGMLRPRAAAPLPAPDRPLLLAGCSLTTLGLLFGMLTAWRNLTFEEPALSAALESLARAMTQGAGPAALDALLQYRTIQTRLDLTAAAHSHAVGFGLLLATLAYVTPHLRISVTGRIIIRLLGSVGGFVLPVCILLALRYGFGFALGADTAGALVILALLMVVKGLLGPLTVTASQPRNMPASRYLVAFTITALLLGLAGSALWQKSDLTQPLLAERENLQQIVLSRQTASQHLDIQIRHARVRQAHGHLLNLCLLTLLAALLLPRAGPRAAWLSAALSVAVIAYPLGLLFNTTAGHLLALAGSLTILAGWLMLSFAAFRERSPA